MVEKTSGVLCCQLPNALLDKSAVVCLMIGFNDCDNEPYNFPQTMENINSICSQLNDNGIKFIVQTNLSCTIEYNSTIGNNLTAERIEQLNDSIVSMCQTNGYNLLDNRNSVLVEGMYLKEKYSTDGVHLTDEGYKIWGCELFNIIKDYR